MEGRVGRGQQLAKGLATARSKGVWSHRVLMSEPRLPSENRGFLLAEDSNTVNSALPYPSQPSTQSES